MSHSRRRWLVVGAIGSLLIVVAYAALPSARRNVILPLPSDNAYDEIAELSKRIDPAVDRWEEADADQLDGIVAANAPIVTAARELLARPVVVPVMLEDPSGANGLRRLETVTRLGRAMLAAISHARQTGNVEQARSLSIDLIRFARAVSYGGVSFDHMKAVAYQRAALEELKTQHVAWEASTLRAAEKEIRAAGVATEEVDVIGSRDLYVAAQVQSLVQRVLWKSLWRSMARTQIQSIQTQLTKSYRECSSQAAEVRLRMMLRAFELEQGALPEELAELVPEFLPELPGAPAAIGFVYERTADGYSLQSTANGD